VHDNEMELTFMFGDENNLVELAGRCRATDAKSEQEIMQVFSTCYYDNNFSTDPLEAAIFTIDTTLLPFHFTPSDGGGVPYLYLPEANSTAGYYELVQNPKSFYRLTETDSYVAKGTVNSVEITYKQNGITVISSVNKDTIINGCKAYEVITKAITKSAQQIWYCGIVIEKNGNTIMFEAQDADQGKYIQAYLRLIGSLKFR